MEQGLIPILALIAGLLVGGAAAYFFASRPAADLRERLSEADTRARSAEDALSEVRSDLSAAKERASRTDALAAELADERNKRLAVSERLAQVESSRTEQAKAFEEQKAALVQAREAMLPEFKATGAEVLKANQDEFLKRAEARFKESEATGEAKIKALLNPVGEEFAKLTKKVADFDEKRVADFGNLKGLMQSMQETQEAVRAEAAQLGSSLRNAPKTRGRWGEHQLRNVLEQCGLTEHTDFELEASVDGSEGRGRPDAIVNVPGDKQLVIDAKVSLTAYQDAFSAETEDERKALLKKHASDMKTHVQTLASKNYQNQFPRAPDYVVMFVPGEHFLSAALEHDGDLWEFAFKKRILLATPTNLVAIARTVASVWQQRQLTEDAQEIAKTARLLFESVSKVTGDFHKMGSNLSLAVKSYNEFGKTLEGNLTSRARRLSEKYIDVGSKEVRASEFIEEEPRYNAADAEEIDAIEDKRDAGE